MEEEKLKKINRLSEEFSISFEEAKNALDINEWDSLDAVLYLETERKIKSPNIDIFYTNMNTFVEHTELLNLEKEDEYKNQRNDYKFQNIFEFLCRKVEELSSIFIVVKKQEREIFNIPIILIILLIFSGIGIGFIIILLAIGLFLDFEYYLRSKLIDTKYINQEIKSFSNSIRYFKKYIRERFFK